MHTRGPLLTSRDLAVLEDLYKYRYLSVSQVHRLHFPSLQTAYRRLRALGALGYIEGFTAPHIPEHLYYLTERGAGEVAAALGVEPEDLNWRETSRAPKDYYFLRHFLKVNDFRIRLTQECPEAGLSLLGFIPEYHGRKTQKGGMVKYIRDVACGIERERSEPLAHTPDAVFALQKGEQPGLFFLEIDRGTEVISDPEKGVLKCLRFYLQYLLSGGYQRYQQDFRTSQFRGFRALLVTTTDIRVEHIRQEAQNLSVIDARAKKFLWLCSETQIHCSGVFHSAWVSADAQDQTRYRIG